MSFSSRLLRPSVFCLFPALSLACAAQQQFQSVPQVYATGGRVTSLVAGVFQNPPSLTDILYINAPVGTGTSTSITAGLMLNSNGQNFNNLTLNQITFPNVSNAVAAVADFNNDNFTDYAFALTPTAGGPNLCVYYGTGATVAGAAGGVSSLNGGNAYPPANESGCMTFPLSAPNPNFSYIAAFPFKAGFPPQLVIEDSANNLLYVIANNGITGANGALTGFSLLHVYSIPAADGAGPLYVGDFNGDGNTDLIINGQQGLSATVYFGDGAGGRLPPVPQNRYVFDHNVHSMLMQDMDGDHHLDMVVEGDNGVIEIFHGNADGTFNTNSEGGTLTGANGFSGDGGHLAAIDPTTLDILTTTPIGLSVLQGNGSLGYLLKNIYNIGPGRSSYAVANFFGSGNLDFAVDSVEGVAIVRADANGDGGFQTSHAYTTLAPALSAVVGKFRTAAAGNPAGHLDVVAATGATQGQLLTGNGDGTFMTSASPVNSLPPGAYAPATAWSNISAGDFDGDGKLDILYTMTGDPPSISALPTLLYTQYGNGDGTFTQSGFPLGAGGSPGPGWESYYETVLGDFNGDGASDLAVNAASDVQVFNGCPGQRSNYCAGFIGANSANARFNQVAAGFFKAGRTNKQDLIYQEGANFVPYLNSGDGIHFTAEPAITGASAPYYASTVLLTDIDGDGNGDLVVVYYNTAANPVGAGPVSQNQIDIWYGHGDGTFDKSPHIIGPGRNYYLGAVADMNGDGLPDLVLSDGSLVGVLYNQGNRSFGGEQHYLAGQGINSLSVVDVNGDGEPDVVVANGGATISNPIVLGGETAASLTLTPNPDVNTGGITVLLDSIATKPVTGTLVATPEPSSLGAAFTLTATLESSPGVAEPTGTIQFYIDGAQVGAAGPVAQGASSSTASYTVPAGNGYQTGTHPISAIYSGDQLNSPVTLAGAAGTHAISGGGTTTQLFLCIGPTPACPSNGVISPPPPYVAALTMYYGQTWNGTTQASANDGSALTGTVSLNDVYTGSALPPVNPICTLPVTGGACPAAVGTTIGTSIGVNVFTSSYSGDASHLPSTSPSVAITVLADTTTATLTGTPNPQTFGQPVTFTATLTGNAAPPTGPVSIFEVFPATGTQTLLGTANLTPGTGNSSTATVTTSTLPVGTDSIQAVYPPTTNFGAAASPAITETITPPVAGSFTLSVSPASSSVGVGYAGVITVTVTALNGFAQDVKLSCSNLPYEASCLFGSPTITGGSGNTELFVQTTAPHNCNASQPYFLGSNGGGSGVAPIALPALAGVLLLILPGRRRWMRALVAMAIVAGATHLTGCGNCTDLGTRPNTYTLTVTGTAVTSSETQAQPVTITVTI